MTTIKQPKGCKQKVLKKMGLVDDPEAPHVEAINLTLAEVEEEIDFMDIQLMLTEVHDIISGEKVEVPKEVLDLWGVYWDHIKKELLKNIKGGNKK